MPLLSPTATVYWTPETATTLDPAEGDDLLYHGTTGEISSPVLSSSAKYYGWGAVVTITNDHGTDGFFIIVASGYPLKTNKETMSAQDDDSITENGTLKYKYPDNHLIQARTISQEISDDLLDTFVIPRKDISIDWRGNQAIELLDKMQVPEYNKDGINTQGTFFIYKQQTEYDGTLKQNTDGRKIATTTTTAP